MKHEDIILKVQAFVDGELPESEQGEIASLIARDPDVSALVRELKQTRQALAMFDDKVELPESREFYWSKIRRELEKFPVEGPQPRKVSFGPLIMRWLIPATCLAAMVAAGFLFLPNSWLAGDEVTWQATNDDVNAFTYRDYEEGLTVMWLSYPSDNMVANSEEAATIN